MTYSPKTYNPIAMTAVATRDVCMYVCMYAARLKQRHWWNGLTGEISICAAQ